MPAPVIDNHPHRDRMVARLRAGAKTADVAAEYGVPYETLKAWWRRFRKASPTIEVEAAEDELDAELDKALAMAQRARERGLEVTSIAVQTGEREGSWDGWQRDDEDAPAVSGRQTSERTERKARVAVRLPKADEDVAPPLVLEPVEVTVRVTNPPRRHDPKPDGRKCAVVFPDAQVWYWQDEAGRLIPTHDEAALDVAHQVLDAVQHAVGVDVVVDLGDFVDWPTVSRHRSGVTYLGPLVTNAALRRAAEILAVRTALTPDAEARWLIPGNHDSRPATWIADNATPLAGVRAAGDGALQFDINHLYGVERHGWQLAAAYPQGRVALTHNLYAIHGTTIRPTASATNEAYLTDASHSTIYGHTHRAGISYRTRETERGRRTVLAGSPGCLARVDGVVPSASTGLLVDGKADASKGERWQQGLFVIHYDADGSTLPEIEHVVIYDGRASWRGRVFTARVDVDGQAVGA